jgi:hypothetical protein
MASVKKKLPSANCGPLMPTEKEIEVEAKKLCLPAFEPYTYGPYFDALRDEFRRKARGILEARELAAKSALSGPEQ